jgi:GntR family transcriptional regulator, transcriptional repressor for pyruvate dehydrogenase complex
MAPIPKNPLDTLPHEGLTDRAAAALRAYIVSNHLAPGTRLPAGPVLASSLGVSHSVLRQAVASLVGLGMLRVVHGSGIYVADVADSEVFQQIASWIGPDSLDEHDYLEVRAIWDRGVYELVMKRARPADLDHLEELGLAMLSADDPKEVDARHHEFHEALLHATGNRFLITLGTILQRFFWEFGYRDGFVHGPPARRFLSGHRSIVELLRSGDPTVIGLIISMHLEPRLGDEDPPESGSGHGHTAVAKGRSRAKAKTSQPTSRKQSKP